MLEQRVEAQTRELSEAAERVKSLFEHAPVAMLMADRSGTLCQVNTGAERLFNYRKDELIGQNVNILLPEARRQQHRALRTAYSGAPAARPMGFGRDLFGRCKDGREIPVEIGLNPLRIDGQTFVVASIVDLSTRRQAEQRVQFVMRELTHRSKNLLAVVQAIARRTAASSPDLQSFHRNFGERLSSLAKCDDLLAQRNWEGARIDDLVRSQLASLAETDTDRIVLQGPPVMLLPEVAQHLGMALHELATNAVKYGALCVPAGKLQITWQAPECAEGRRLVFSWRERRAAAANFFPRKGYGHVILQEIVPGMLSGTATLAFSDEGMTWTLDAPLESNAGATTACATRMESAS